MARTKNIKHIKPRRSESGMAGATMPLFDNLATSSSNHERENSFSGSEEERVRREKLDSTTDSEDDNYKYVHFWGI